MSSISEKLDSAINDLELVRLAYEEKHHKLVHYESNLRRIRDQCHGDAKCWKDLEEVFALLPEGYTPPPRDTAVQLKHCEQFIASCNNPQTVYVSPDEEIQRLKDEIQELKDELILYKTYTR